ncbi:MAG: MCE family protein [Rhodococcus sp.]|uniref:MCE family protein n=1 Tax=Rhodococcus TaxID=1827 RepID=UPI0016B37798|nr:MULTISPECIES: MCE family protein [Rhodococcus]NLV78461.1 MCE family protein [Rhodococcus sp. (in: high G+C Gram-positive bacteria)]
MSGIREPNTLRIGAVGLAVSTAIVVAGLQYDQLQFLSGGVTYSAHFADAGGLMAGDDVMLAGVNVGSVTDIALDGQAVLVTFRVRDGIGLGEDTGVDIKTNTVLGAKSLTVRPAGDGLLRPGSVIALEHTNSPYSLTDALGDLTTSVSELDTDQVNESLDALSEAMTDTPPELRGALEGMSRLSKSINDRDESLSDLLERAESVTGILAERSDRINELVVDANALFGELSVRRDAITALITNISTVSRELTGLVQDNQDQMGPTLEKLNAVTANLQANKDNIAGALDGLGPYISALGESVASGPFFNAYVSNILPAPWWKAVVDSQVAPELLPQDLQDIIPTDPPSIKKDGE